MLPKKTVTAFKFTCDDLFRTSEHVYFWTFTVKELMPSWWVPNTWHHFQRAIQDEIGKFKGVRVFEWHQNHGLHIHALVNVRLNIHDLRRIGGRFGFGVMWVKVANKNAPQYLCKYLGKDQGKMPYGGRQWARFGGVKFGSKVKDLRITGARADYIRARMIELRPYTTQFRAMQQAATEYDLKDSFAVIAAGLADEIATAED